MFTPCTSGKFFDGLERTRTLSRVLGSRVSGEGAPEADDMPVIDCAWVVTRSKKKILDVNKDLLNMFNMVYNNAGYASCLSMKNVRCMQPNDQEKGQFPSGGRSAVGINPTDREEGGRLPAITECPRLAGCV
jgi:hypothetical protein